jgi:predicted glycogen debranching enzyme
MTIAIDEGNEWLETDGLGGFASGTVAGVRTRRYHALLSTARNPPGDRVVLVNGVEAHLQTRAGSFALTTERYQPGVLHPDGARHLRAFTNEPWPTWRYELPDGTHVEHELFVTRDASCVVLTWRLAEPRPDAELVVRPFMSGRELHALHHENPAFDFEPHPADGTVSWRPYPSLPRIVASSTGVYTHRPDWYRSFLYAEERARGLDDTEDLATPGLFTLWFDDHGEAVLILAADELPAALPATTLARQLRAVERERRATFATPLHRAADDYLVRRGNGRTIIAGYPWFGDWGRDTFIALRGLCLATGRLDDARQILDEWAGVVADGMLPNRFADGGDAPEYNSVDASLWYVVAVGEYLAAAGDVAAVERKRLYDAVEAILEGYARGTRHGIALAADGLMASGGPGVQLTWMDAKIGDWVVTPRTGKAVEIQALWVNALAVGSVASRWAPLFKRALRAFRERFWNEARGCLYDVVDVDHRAGVVDATLRPNQIFAVGGLPLPLVGGERARRIVDCVEATLWTPLGLRSLAPGEPGYAERYEGGPVQRDSTYHQGTVWPWLIGPFVEAWLRVRGSSDAACREAERRFVAPLIAHLSTAGIGHVSEIADAEPPHTPRGCPFQAWSVAELLRLQQHLLARLVRAA